MLDAGRYGSVTELAVGEKLDRSYLGRILMPTLRVPDIVLRPPRFRFQRPLIRYLCQVDGASLLSTVWAEHPWTGAGGVRARLPAGCFPRPEQN